MSGTVLGKSCLVLGAEFGMWNARAVPGAVPGTGTETGARNGHCQGIQFPGGMGTGEAQPQLQPSPWEGPAAGIAPVWIRGWAGAAGGPGPGAPQPKPQHSTIPPTLAVGNPSWSSSGAPGAPEIALELLKQLWSSWRNSGAALELLEQLWSSWNSSGSGEVGSRALAPLCPSGCPALTSLLGFPEHWHIKGRSFNPDPRICWEGKNLEVVYSPMGNSNLTCSGPCGSASIETLQRQQRSVQKMTLNTAKVVSLSFQQFAFWAKSIILCLRLYFTCPRQVLHHSHKFWLSVCWGHS